MPFLDVGDQQGVHARALVADEELFELIVVCWRSEAALLPIISQIPEAWERVDVPWDVPVLPSPLGVATQAPKLLLEAVLLPQVGDIQHQAGVVTTTGAGNRAVLDHIRRATCTHHRWREHLDVLALDLVCVDL